MGEEDKQAASDNVEYNADLLLFRVVLQALIANCLVSDESIYVYTLAKPVSSDSVCDCLCMMCEICSDLFSHNCVHCQCQLSVQLPDCQAISCDTLCENLVFLLGVISYSVIT